MLLSNHNIERERAWAPHLKLVYNRHYTHAVLVSDTADLTADVVYRRCHWLCGGRLVCPETQAGVS